MTIRETLAEGIKLLTAPSESALIDTPSLDGTILLAHTLGCDRTELILRDNEPISEKSTKEYKTLLERRRSGECIAYILGYREFRGLRFSVSPHVLVPRPDTETLVEAALEYIDLEKDTENLFVLDLCTGSGALAVSLKYERPFLHVTASDISPQALEIAILNSKLCLQSKTLDPSPQSLYFIQSDLFENISGRFNIIVSNPPYVPSGELAGLAPEVQREPALALDGGEDGLFFYRAIIAQAPKHLLPGGVLLFEAGPEQMPAIRELLEAHGFYSVRLYKDLGGRDRVISAVILRLKQRQEI